MLQQKNAQETSSQETLHSQNSTVQNKSSQMLQDYSLNKVLEELERNLIVTSYTKFRNTRKVAHQLSISQSKASQLVRKYCKDLDLYN